MLSRHTHLFRASVFLEVCELLVFFPAARSERLEKAKGELQDAMKQLECERAKTDALLYQMLPQKVADQMKAGTKIPPGISII